LYTDTHTAKHQEHNTAKMMDKQPNNKQTTETIQNTETRKSNTIAQAPGTTNTGLNTTPTSQQLDSTHPTKPPWGHPLRPKDPNQIRLVLQNIGGIDMMESGSIKLAALQSFLQAAQVDMCMLTECNNNNSRIIIQIKNYVIRLLRHAYRM